MTPSNNTTPAPESTGSKVLTFFEKFVLGLIAAAPSTLPVFFHSQHGIAVVNAGEGLLGSVLEQLTANNNTPTQ